MSRYILVLQAMRLPFLVLAPICVFLAVAIARSQQVAFDGVNVFLCLLGALAAHIAVNTLNEYQDFKSGLDFKTVRTPFSGGSGLLPTNPEVANQVLLVCIIALLLTVTVGCYFVALHGWQIVPLGLFGLLLVVTYTRWINRNALLCLLAPGIGFGIFIVGGSYFCITGEYNNTMWQLSFIPFLLINNLLLVNQYPDIDADKSVGRNHFPIKYGVKVSTAIYILFSVSAQLLLAYLVFLGGLPDRALFAFIPMLLSYGVMVGLLRLGKNIAVNPKFLAANVGCSVLTPLVLAISLYL